MSSSFSPLSFLTLSWSIAVSFFISARRFLSSDESAASASVTTATTGAFMGVLNAFDSTTCGVVAPDPATDESLPPLVFLFVCFFCLRLLASSFSGASGAAAPGMARRVVDRNVGDVRPLPDEGKLFVPFETYACPPSSSRLYDAGVSVPRACGGR